MYANEVKLGNDFSAPKQNMERMEKKVVHRKRRKTVDRTILSENGELTDESAEMYKKISISMQD